MAARYFGSSPETQASADAGLSSAVPILTSPCCQKWVWRSVWLDTASFPGLVTTPQPVSSNYGGVVA